MWNRWTVALGLLLVVQCRLYAKPANQLDRPQLAVLFCDKVGLDTRSRATVRSEVVRIFAHAGVDIRWDEAIGGQDSPTSFNMISTEGCHPASNDSRFDFLIVLSREAYKRVPVYAMGFAVTTPSRRAYIFHERVRGLVDDCFLPKDQKHATAITLGNVIGHELGHLLLPNEGHSVGGIMRAIWNSPEVSKAMDGTMLFQPDQVRRIQARFAGPTALQVQQ